jgi:hypothetical protein
MPAPPLSNTFEGGSDGTTISPANSGGASGDAFDVVTTGVGSTQTFSIEQEAHGSLSAKLTTPASSPTATRMEWTGLGSITGSLWIRFYLYRTALPSGNFIPIAVRTNAAAASANFLFTSTGKMNMQNAAGTSQGASTGPSMSLNQWVRVEIRILSSTTVGEAVMRLYNTPDALIGSESDSKDYGAAMVLGANSDQIRIGHCPAIPLPSDTAYFDDLALSTVGWIGPAAASPQSPPAHLPFMRR